ncbi:class C beta-lactamase [Marinivivus vitaminiproducens]|uniref:class C beta-lactamase n=1 Tax=Marinivivus vitaminiproducens TaxID=3035935 RepID=UPI0027A025C5|nr:beta-lactamase [Geminicoccaceae bacterium SCSIO 64248]
MTIPRAAGRLALAILGSCLLVSGLLVSGPVGAAGAQDRLEADIDRIVRPLPAAHDVPGLAVAVTVGGRSRVFAYGVASKADGTPVGADTLFEIGSLSKTFTATAIGYAQALGALALDDSPGEALPTLRGHAIDRASLLQLATYTAGGLPLQFPDDVADEAGMTAYFQTWQPSAPPGAQRRYSNPSIGLAGLAAAAAMDMGFAELAETRLFPALGLRDSHVRVPAAAMDRYAWGYSKANAPVRVNPGALDAEAYGVRSTARDMIRFVEANLRPDRLDGPIRKAVEATQAGHFAVGPMVQGLGWEQYPWPVPLERLLAGNASGMALEPQDATAIVPPRTPSRPTLFNKTGSTNGFGAYAAFVPAEGIGVVMLANRNLPIPARVAAAHAVLERLSAEAR